MKTKDSESLTTMPRFKPELVRIASLCVIAFVVLFVMVLVFSHVKSTSYARLAPVGVSVELSFFRQLNPRNELILEYDYGYGYIPGHSQSRVISSGQEPQVVEFSISSWKPIGAIRLRVKDEQGVVPHAVTFTRLGDSTRVLLSEVDDGIVLTLDEAEAMFSNALLSAAQPRSE